MFISPASLAQNFTHSLHVYWCVVYQVDRYKRNVPEQGQEIRLGYSTSVLFLVLLHASYIVQEPDVLHFYQIKTAKEQTAFLAIDSDHIILFYGIFPATMSKLRRKDAKSTISSAFDLSPFRSASATINGIPKLISILRNSHKYLSISLEPK